MSTPGHDVSVNGALSSGTLPSGALPSGASPPDGGGPSGDTAESRAALLRFVCSSVADVLALTARPPARLRVALDGASVELDWLQAVPAAAVGAAGVVLSDAVEAGPPLLAAPELPAVVAPLVGTFYRSPTPREPPFVSVGDTVVVGQQIGIVEAMKLMNPVEADVAGVVTEILVEDAEPVEYGQVLLRVTPVEED